MHPALRKYLDGKIIITPEQEQLVNSCFQLKFTQRHEILVPKGSIAKHLYLVVKGCLRVFLTGEDGSESTRFLLFEGQMGTAFPSFILNQPSVATVESLEPSELLLLSYPDQQILLREVPGWETMYRVSLERNYIASIQRIESFITLNAKARYDILMQNHPEIIKRLPSKIVADYLGISQETLSRLKTKK
ncbi:Crp/Fnr family transcriptional regulator [Adhaeribacter radiodurans]|uniref:Crp/Fnr family transcriptional regulator n=1 Tax=Adhaeribacter radiodurans TaxID=2745197 RepID=A0A7L7L9K5_9BACT|nr:cyclic nucleotide-binding domain-containing protein [Adhaeribacter radiodurans]QMU29510.1 Crp/Fnr family transcriptional regulator [Adhaeribacter radiodurans]